MEAVGGIGRHVRALIGLGVALALAVTACGDDGEASEDTRLPGTQGEQAEQPDKNGAAGDAASAEFDECSPISPDELASAIAADEVYLNGRSVKPVAEGGWEFQCLYGTRDIPGQGIVLVSFVTETDRARHFAPFEGENTEPLEIGDHAELLEKVDPSGMQISEFRALAGDSGLYIQYILGIDMPSFSEVLTSGLPASLLDRAPGDVTITEVQAEGLCADFDVNRVSQVLGDDLITARSVVNSAGAVRCDYQGYEAKFQFTVMTDPQMVDSLTLNQVTLPDVGDGAWADVGVDTDTGSTHLDGIISLDQRVIDLSGTYGSSVGTLLELRPEDLDMLHAVVDAAR